MEASSYFPRSAVALSVCLTLAMTMTGCGPAGEDATDSASKYEVEDKPSAGDVSEPTASSLAELAGVVPDATGDSDSETGTGDLVKPPSLTSTDLDSQQLALPEGGINQIQAFLQQLQRRMSTVSTQEEAIELLKLQEQAADRMMAPGVDEVTRVNAVLIKVDAMRMLAAFRVPDADAEYLDYCALIEKDQNPTVSEQGRIRRFEIKSVWFLNNRGDVSYDAIKSELTDLVSDEGTTGQTVAVVQEFAQRVFRGEHRDKGTEVLTIAAEAFLRSEDEYVQSAGNVFQDQLLLAQLSYDQAREAVYDGVAGSEQEMYDLTMRLLTERPPSNFTVDQSMFGARALEINHHYELALQLFQQIAAAAAKGEDESLSAGAQGAADRAAIRLNLIGKEVEIDGNLAEGAPFDWQQYRGKTVLVCFWATQWGPSLKEFDLMTQVRDKYKDQAFEIVGINADETAQELEFFLTRTPVPWATVVSDDAEQVGLESPMTRAFGIDSSPCNFLVDPSGKVTQMHLYGDELETAIALALGLQPPADDESLSPSPSPEGTEDGEPGDSQQTRNSLETKRPVSPTAGPRFSWVSFNASVQEEVAEDDQDNPYLAPSHYSTDDLVDFLFDMEEKARSLQRRTEFVDAVVDAADRVLADEQAKPAYRRIAAINKLQTLHRLAVLDTPGFEERLRVAVESLGGESNKKVVEEVQFLRLEGKAIQAKDLDEETRLALLAELKSFFEAAKLETRHLRMASATVAIINLIENEADPKVAAEQREEWFKSFGELFAKSKDKQLAGYGKQLAKAPAAGTPNVVGEALELAGDTHGGLPFDWESYRGKVVVVDFWATWCGPCLRELPNVRKTHAELVDQGFEVVGISIDQDLDALTEFLDRELLPWPTLSGEGAQAKARALGVRAIPTMMLIDREGKIVQVANRIEQLRPEIDRLLEDGNN